MMMQYCVLEVHSQTATFRNPEFQNFHKTFDLPPPTTLIGFLGAALGLSPLAAQEFFTQCEMQIGVSGKSSGKAKDTWKYAKYERRMMHAYSPSYGSVIAREILVNNRFYLVFGTAIETAFQEMLTAFHNPKYALTLGSSDSLAFIKRIHVLKETCNRQEIEHCLLEGNVINEVLALAATNFEFSIYQSSDPIAYDLPLRFTYKSDYGSRAVSEVGTLSFVSHKMKLNFDVEGVLFDDHFIPVFKA